MVVSATATPISELGPPSGPVELKRPKQRNTTERFASTLCVVRQSRRPFGAVGSALVISAWVRCLSDRDIEALLGEALGPDATLSNSTASRICQRLNDDFEAFRTPSLADVDIDYQFLDGSHSKQHDGTGTEPVTVVHAIIAVGQPVLLAVEPATVEFTHVWPTSSKGVMRVS